jgi:protein phosphatase
LPVAALLVVVAGLWGAYAWTQTQYFVGDDDGNVVIFKGIPQTLGPVTLHSVAEVSDVAMEDLKPFERERVESGLRTDNLAEARDIVDSLRKDG